MVVANDHIHRLTTSRRDRITRSSRVRLLAKQVAAGEYRVDPDKLAEVLVERAQFHQRVKADLLAQRSASEL
ncbi:MAG TPA: flagellar biosynthesis anti-sigma factor FlgM [Conexibacter sp.]|nr:flagellar biosynthesis anti-sigma factor FlgM [Conexibacter sp.]